ncbi:hypothetical protein OAI94_01545, partial [bacterium]|nr:hypothetical protein [bacterium]
MKKSTKIRIIIFEILIEIYKNNKNFDELFETKIKLNKLNEQDRSFVYNISINTMRYNLHSKKILKLFVKKKLKPAQYILLISAITQLVFLKIKNYAVVFETVEVAKKIGLYPAFINAVLKKIDQDKKKLEKIDINMEDFPMWFQDEIKKDDRLNLNLFFNSYFHESSLHVVFKSNKLIHFFKEKYELSSKDSAFIKSHKKVPELSNYDKGHWWVQNFSSMIPIKLCESPKNKDILDLCAAPGGKAFQLLSQNTQVLLNDKSKRRIKKLKENLFRLNLSAIIKNYDALFFPENKKFDLVIIDAPCSSIGTVRSNPEIIFKNKAPDMKSLNELQKNLLIKSSKILKTKGIINYMVCSFFISETIDPIQKFLNINKNFSILKYNYWPKEFEKKDFL